jgi:hypothetical protein
MKRKKKTYLLYSDEQEGIFNRYKEMRGEMKLSCYT